MLMVIFSFTIQANPSLLLLPIHFWFFGTLHLNSILSFQFNWPFWFDRNLLLHALRHSIKYTSREYNSRHCKFDDSAIHQHHQHQTLNTWTTATMDSQIIQGILESLQAIHLNAALAPSTAKLYICNPFCTVFNPVTKQGMEIFSLKTLPLDQQLEVTKSDATEISNFVSLRYLQPYCLKNSNSIHGRNRSWS